jgi:hypothetical protein
MTREQIIGNVVISLIVGLFLIVMGAILQPLLKRLWQRMNRPMPLTPQTRGQLLLNRTIWEGEIERLDYLSTHKKDLFLLLIQLMMAVLIASVAAFWLYVFRQLFREGPPADFILLVIVILLTFAGVVAGVGLWQAGRLSDKKIEATKGSIQKRIDEIDRQLNPPPA